MTTNDDEGGALGAEALPGGFAEIHRILHAAPSDAGDVSLPELRVEAKTWYWGWRRQTSDNSAG
jgi:hypothetical protein